MNKCLLVPEGNMRNRQEATELTMSVFAYDFSYPLLPLTKETICFRRVRKIAKSEY